MANDPKATCNNGRECCELGWDNVWRHVTSYKECQPGSFDTWTNYLKRRATFCPQTGEALRVVDGQPVVTPRPNDEYVRLLEVLSRLTNPLQMLALLFNVIGWTQGEHPCFLRAYRKGLIGSCTHEDPPVGCLRALAAEREKEECDRG